MRSDSESHPWIRIINATRLVLAYRSLLLLALALALPSVASPGVALAADDSTPPGVGDHGAVEHARHRFQEISSAVRTLSYSFQMTGPGGPGAPECELRGTFVSRGSQWSQTDLETRIGGATQPPDVRRTVFDGEHSYHASYDRRGDSLANGVLKKTGPPVPLPDPLGAYLGFLPDAAFAPWGRLLDQANGTIAGNAAGPALVRFDLGPCEGKGAVYERVVVLDSSRDYWPQRIENRGTNGFGSVIVEVTAWERVLDQLSGREVWLPSAIQRTSSHRNHPDVVVMFRYTQLVLNADVPDTMFEVPLKAGAPIVDETTPGTVKTTYYAPAGAAQRIVRPPLQLAKPQAGPLAVATPRPSPLWVDWSTACALLVFLLAAWYLVRVIATR